MRDYVAVGQVFFYLKSFEPKYFGDQKFSSDQNFFEITIFSNPIMFKSNFFLPSIFLSPTLLDSNFCN